MAPLVGKPMSFGSGSFTHWLVEGFDGAKRSLASGSDTFLCPYVWLLIGSIFRRWVF